VSPSKSERVLEIGTGSGFLTACLARLALDVVSVEQHADFVDAARARLAGAGVRNARVERADAVRGEAVNGFTPEQQFDVMLVTGAVAAIPPRWREWIKPAAVCCDRRRIAGATRVLYTRGNDGGWSEEVLFETDLPYLTNAAPTARFTL